MSADQDRVQRVMRLGFTERQARFLVTVMLHSGVCIQRQYCAFARISHGNVPRTFFGDLVRRRYASAYPCRRGGGRLYHVHHKGLYEAIGEPDNRNRRAMSVACAIERLIVLDTVLDSQDVRWLATESEKRAHFEATTRLRPDEMPTLTFKTEGGHTVRYFPDKLPIGVHGDADTHVFVYVVNRDVPVDFRPYLYRHARLLAALRTWVIRLLVPGHFGQAATAFREACEEELGTRLAPSTVDELRWYFTQQREADAALDHERFRRARRAFGGTRYRVLYRHWLRGGDGLLDALDSPVLPDALERGSGRITTEVVGRRYEHLAPMVGTA